MFSECYKLKKIKGINNFNTANATELIASFQGCRELEYLDLTNFDTSKVIDMSCLFSQCFALKEIKGINNFNTANVTNMIAMFQGCNELVNLDLSNFNTAKVTIMSYMFNQCFELQYLNISNFNISFVTNMEFIS